MLKCYDRIEEVVGKILRAMCIFFLCALLMVFVMNILDRIFHFTTMAWFEEIVTLCFAWLAFLGAAELWRGKNHFKVDFFVERLKKKESVAIANFISDLISLIFFIIILVFSIKWITGVPSTTPALAMPTSVLYMSVPVAVALMSLMSLRDLVGDIVCCFKK